MQVLEERLQTQSLKDSNQSVEGSETIPQPLTQALEKQAQESSNQHTITTNDSAPEQQKPNDASSNTTEVAQKDVETKSQKIRSVAENFASNPHPKSTDETTPTSTSSTQLTQSQVTPSATKEDPVINRSRTTGFARAIVPKGSSVKTAIGVTRVNGDKPNNAYTQLIESERSYAKQLKIVVKVFLQNN